MIVDHLSNLGLYQSVNSNIKSVLEYLAKTPLDQIPLGKTIIDGDKCYLSKEVYIPKDESETSFESHKNYLDIQLVVRGLEAIGYAYINDAKIISKTDYNPEKDLIKYQIDEYTKVALSSLMFALVLPDDLHRPKIRISPKEEIVKIVFKLKLD